MRFLILPFLFVAFGAVAEQELHVTESTIAYDGVTLSLANGESTRSSVRELRYIQNKGNCRPTNVDGVWVTPKKREVLMWSTIASGLPNNIAYCVPSSDDKELSVLTHVVSDHESAIPSLNRLIKELRSRGLNDSFDRH